ncbi:MAG: hypothetical protein IID45_03580, partial [Planctomycetes bacterium]|nr:hypothetical protein [Planctomycetota bacterium]
MSAPLAVHCHSERRRARLQNPFAAILLLPGVTVAKRKPAVILVSGGLDSATVL